MNTGDLPTVAKSVLPSAYAADGIAVNPRILRKTLINRDTVDFFVMYVSIKLLYRILVKK